LGPLVSFFEERASRFSAFALKVGLYAVLLLAL